MAIGWRRLTERDLLASAAAPPQRRSAKEPGRRFQAVRRVVRVPEMSGPHSRLRMTPRKPVSEPARAEAGPSSSGAGPSHAMLHGAIQAAAAGEGHLSGRLLALAAAVATVWALLGAAALGAGPLFLVRPPITRRSQGFHEFKGGGCSYSLAQGSWTDGYETVSCANGTKTSFATCAAAPQRHWAFAAAAKGCGARRVGAEEARRLLAGRRLVFAGDSIARNLYGAALRLLGQPGQGIVVGHADFRHQLEGGIQLEFYWVPYPENLTALLARPGLAGAAAVQQRQQGQEQQEDGSKEAGQVEEQEQGEEEDSKEAGQQEEQQKEAEAQQEDGGKEQQQQGGMEEETAAEEQPGQRQEKKEEQQQGFQSEQRQQQGEEEAEEAGVGEQQQGQRQGQQTAKEARVATIEEDAEPEAGQAQGRAAAEKKAAAGAAGEEEAAAAEGDGEEEEEREEQEGREAARRGATHAAAGAAASKAGVKAGGESQQQPAAKAQPAGEAAGGDADAGERQGHAAAAAAAAQLRERRRRLHEAAGQAADAEVKGEATSPTQPPSLAVFSVTLWHLLHVAQPEDFQQQMGQLNAAAAAFAASLGGSGSDVRTASGQAPQPLAARLLLASGTETFPNRMKTAQKQRNMTPANVDAYNRAMEQAGVLAPAGPLTLLDLFPLTRSCGEECTIDGIHSTPVVYDAALQLLLNIIDPATAAAGAAGGQAGAAAGRRQAGQGEEEGPPSLRRLRWRRI